VLGATTESSRSPAWSSGGRRHKPTGRDLHPGLAGLVAGAVSMALGEYVSVSSHAIPNSPPGHRETRIAEYPAAELAELARALSGQRLSSGTALRVAKELTAHDPLAAHLRPNSASNSTNSPAPAGRRRVRGVVPARALLPLVAILLPPAGWRVPVTVVAVLAALALTATISAHLSGANNAGCCCVS